MLQHLFGSKSAERILLFLWVNERCYASQIQKACGCALTPLQYILRKFELAGILVASLQGRKKLYCLNSDYLVYTELKALLQKGFANLPAEEKKSLFVYRNSGNAPSYAQQKRRALCLQAFGERLLRTQQMTIRTQDGEEAIGEVKVKEEKPGIFIFTERGRWVKGKQQNMNFHNSLRWSFVFDEGLIRLEHLRHGLDHPIFLSYLTPISSKHLRSIDPHLCQKDCYFGHIEFNSQGIYLTWRVLSDRKNETLHYVYI